MLTAENTRDFNLNSFLSTLPNHCLLSSPSGKPHPPRSASHSLSTPRPHDLRAVIGIQASQHTAHTSASSHLAGRLKDLESSRAGPKSHKTCPDSYSIVADHCCSIIDLNRLLRSPSPRGTSVKAGLATHKRVDNVGVKKQGNHHIIASSAR